MRSNLLDAITDGRGLAQAHTTHALVCQVTTEFSGRVQARDGMLVVYKGVRSLLCDSVDFLTVLLSVAPKKVKMGVGGFP